MNGLIQSAGERRALSTGGRALAAHRYALADFGLTEEQVEERFGTAIIAG